jgi:hypothetical protein
MLGVIYYRKFIVSAVQLLTDVASTTPLAVPLLFQAVKHHSATRSGIDM